jgi:hypothetical protein
VLAQVTIDGKPCARVEALLAPRVVPPKGAPNVLLIMNDNAGVGRGGTGVLKVDRQAVATRNMEHTLPFILQWDENFDLGAQTGTPVDEEYQLPFAFNSTVDKLALIDGPKLSPTDIQNLQEANGTTKSANQTMPNPCGADRQVAQLFRSTEVHRHGGAITSESDTVYSIPPTVCLNPALGHGSELGGR